MDIWLDELARAEACGVRMGDELSFPQILLDLGACETAPRAQMRRSLFASYASHFRRAMEHRHGFDVRAPFGGDGGNVRERIVYVRNPVTDRVFTHLSRFLKSPTVSYQDTLEDACAQVYAEGADFAILPRRGKDGGFARVTLHLLEKYELHAVWGISLSTEEGEQGQFVLAGRDLLPPFERENAPLYLSLTLFPQTEEETASLFAAFAAFGCRVTSLETVHSAYDRVSYRLMLEGEGIKDLLVLLLLDRIGYTVTGLYRLYSTEDSVFH